jgi:hypothetical protein
MTGFTRLARFTGVILVLMTADFAVSLQVVQVVEPFLLRGRESYPGFLALARPGVDLPVARLF